MKFCIKLKQVEEMLLALDETRSIRRTPREVSWIKPDHEWIKLNTDGSVMGNPHRAAFGGVLHDEHDGWLC